MYEIRFKITQKKEEIRTQFLLKTFIEKIKKKENQETKKKFSFKLYWPAMFLRSNT